MKYIVLAFTKRCAEAHRCAMKPSKMCREMSWLLINVDGDFDNRLKYF